MHQHHEKAVNFGYIFGESMYAVHVVCNTVHAYVIPMLIQYMYNTTYKVYVQYIKYICSTCYI